jgi:ParB family chromosome partitioning protein
MSSAAPRGLGRGLGELFQRSEPRVQPPNEEPAANAGTATTTEAAPAPAHPIPEGSYFAELPPGSIRPNPRQPRTVFDEDELNELVDSIAEVGLLQPIVVRPLESNGEAPTYELVMGERRWRAAQAASLDAIPAIVRRTEDADLLRDALLENLHRSQLNPLEEAAAYQRCCRTSTVRRRSCRSGSSARGRRSPTRSDCFGSRPRSSAEWQQACSVPATRGRF